MIIKDEDAIKRLNSPLNLVNRLKNSKTSSGRSSAMSLFGIGKKNDPTPSKFNPFPPSSISESSPIPESSITESSEQTQLIPLPDNHSSIPSSTKLDNIIENHESEIKLGLAHDNAIKLLNASIDALSLKLDDVKAERLPSVIAAASKTIEGIRRERNENLKSNKDREVHFHFYTPEQKKLNDYEVIDA